MRLTDEGRGGIANAISRHVAKALGRDGKGMGGNGNIAQRSHNHRAHDLRTTHQDVLYGDRNANLAGIVHIFLDPAETHLVLTQVEYLVLACRQPKVRKGNEDISRRRTASSTHHSHLEHIDKEVVEHDIANTDEHGHDTRRVHIARRLEHHLGRVIEIDKRQHQDIYQEIARGRKGYVLASTQPIRQLIMDGDTDQGNQKAKEQATDKPMLKHLTRLEEVVGTDEMSHLHGKTRSHRTQQAANQPSRRFDQANAGGSLSAQMSHHRGINEKHHHG